MAYADLDKRRLWAREDYARNPEKTRERNKLKREKRKETIFEHLGGKCCKCDSTERLELDHIDPSLKTSKQSLLSMGLDKALQECDNIQLLCHCCHKEKSLAQKAAAWKLFTSLPLDQQNQLIAEQTA